MRVSFKRGTRAFVITLAFALMAATGNAATATPQRARNQVSNRVDMIRSDPDRGDRILQRLRRLLVLVGFSDELTGPRP